MSSVYYQLAADGWQIISHCSESRESARRLLRRLAETLQISVAEVHFQDRETSYNWHERIERIPSRRLDSDAAWNHKFPAGESFWHIEGFAGDRKALAQLLDLLADQWLRLNTPGKPVNTAQHRRRDAGTNRVDPSWIAVSRPARLIKSLLPRLSHSMRPLLILGEVGTGKSYLASLIHNSGPTPTLPFSGAQSPALTGTLFVSNWRNIESCQKQILINDPRRLIASSDEDAGNETMRKSWSLETDCAGSVLSVPPLRERKADLPMLAGRFIESFISDSGFPLPELSPKALEALRVYPWPGNIRELKEAISWALERCASTRIAFEDLPPAVRGAVGGAEKKRPEPAFSAKLVELEYRVLREELIRQNGNMTRTAKALGLTPRQVSLRVRKYSINPRAYKSQQQAGS